MARSRPVAEHSWSPGIEGVEVGQQQMVFLVVEGVGQEAKPGYGNRLKMRQSFHANNSLLTCESVDLLQTLLQIHLINLLQAHPLRFLCKGN